MGNTRTGVLTVQQQERLLKDPPAIEKVQNHSYVPQHEVRAELTRVFGHGRWDSQVVAMEHAFEYDEPNPNKQGSKRWVVSYRAGVQLRLRDVYGLPLAEFLEWHCATAINPDRGEAHAQAITSAESYALRRAAIGLGDRFGLSLYGKDGENGQPLVKGTLPLLAQQQRAEAKVEVEKVKAEVTEPEAIERVKAELGATDA